MLGFLRFLRGSVDFEVTDGYAERFISNCGKGDLPLYHLKRSGKGLTASTSFKNARRLRETAAKSGVTLRVTRERGVPPTVRRYRMRPGIFVGLALLVLIPLILNMFIWRVEIVGNETVPTNQLRETLSELGVRAGAFRRGINAREVERGMIIKNEGLRWAGVNLRGSRAVIEVREREDVPRPMDTDTPYNIVAKRGGSITRMDVYEGQPAVKNGDSVTQGDILVSGIMENGKLENRTVRARAKVMAQIEESLAVTIPYERVVFGYKGLETRDSLVIFGLVLPLDRGGVPEAPWKLETATLPVKFWSKLLPVRIQRHNYILLEQSTEQVSPDDARVEAEAQLKLLETQKFAPDSVISREVTGQELEDSFILFADYVRLDDIAEEREILLG